MSLQASHLEQWRSMLDAHLFTEATVYEENQFPKDCTACGARHDEESWRQLHFVRLVLNEEPSEVRNCGCQATLAVAIR